MAHMTERKCKHRKKLFMARTADVNRGWAKFCSKSCKAIKQEQRTGQHADFKFRQQIRDANGGMGPADFQREYGGTPVFNRNGEYQGFMGGGFDNTLNQNHGEN